MDKQGISSEREEYPMEVYAQIVEDFEDYRETRRSLGAAITLLGVPTVTLGAMFWSAKEGFESLGQGMVAAGAGIVCISGFAMFLRKMRHESQFIPDKNDIDGYYEFPQ